MDKAELERQKELAEKAALVMAKEEYKDEPFIILGRTAFVKFLYALTPDALLDLIAMTERLEKEIDWLAKRLAEFCDPDHDDQCCVLCRENCNGVDGKEWREAARKAMEASNA